jgi:hypothetical protein
LEGCFRGIVASMRAAILLVTFAASVLSGCVTPARMCSLPSECGAQAACVAGRCQRTTGMPAIQQTRRLVVDPVAVAYLRSIDSPREGALPTSFTLGRDADGEARLYLRFDVPIAKEATVVEAYLLLERADVADADPGPIALHAARVVDPWDPRTISWARQPRIEETRSPVTTVTSSGRVRVRVDVRDLVLRWRSHDRKDQGLVVVADAKTGTGIAFSFATGGASSPSPGLSPEAAGASRPLFGTEPTKLGPASAEPSSPAPIGAPPQLELYVK